MKENPLDDRFAEVAAKRRKNFDEQRVTYFLSALRDAAQELRKGGEKVTLEVRPRLRGAVENKDGVLANATLRLGDDTVVDWLVQRESDSVYLKAFADGGPLAGFYCYRSSGSREWSNYPEESKLRDAIIEAVFAAKADRQILAEYDVADPSISIAKPISVTSPVRLRKGNNP
jgi:hypothetical protein